MNRRFMIVIFAVVILLLVFSTSQGRTIAQVAEMPDVAKPTLQPEGGESSLPLEEGQDSEPAVLSPDNPAALVSNSFTYQGQLKNSGAPVNNYCDFIWNIFADPDVGTSLATDTDTNVLLTNGLFTAVINVPASVLDGNKRYVEIQVRCPTGTGAYTLLSPRQELQAVPYALGLRLPFSHSINSSSNPVFAITNTGGTGSSPAMLGSSVGSNGVQGLSTGGASADNGVYGETNSTSTSEAGVKGVSTGAATGGYFSSLSGDGVYGSASTVTDFGGYFSNATSTTSGGALYANGDAKQSLAGDGFVKAGVYVDCKDSSSLIVRSFNNVNTTAITVIDGTGPGRCTVDFGFNVSNRYISALPFGNVSPRTVTFIYVGPDNRLDFFRYDQTGTGADGGIMILIY
jgi:predicted outer membrane repeat protein